MGENPVFGILVQLYCRTINGSRYNHEVVESCAKILMIGHFITLLLASTNPLEGEKYAVEYKTRMPIEAKNIKFCLSKNDFALSHNICLGEKLG